MVAAVGPGPPHRRRHARVRDHHQRGRVRLGAVGAQRARRPHRRDEPAAARRVAGPDRPRRPPTSSRLSQCDVRSRHSHRRVQVLPQPAPTRRVRHRPTRDQHDRRPDQAGRAGVHFLTEPNGRLGDKRAADRGPGDDRPRRAGGVVLRGPGPPTGRGHPCGGGVDHREHNAPAGPGARHRRRGGATGAHHERDARTPGGLVAAPAAIRVRRVARAAQPARFDPHQPRGRVAALRARRLAGRRRTCAGRGRSDGGHRE